MELDSTNYDAANSLAVQLTDTRDFAGAEQMFRLALASEPSNNTLLTNLADLYTRMGRHEAFDSVMAIVEAGGAPFPTAPMRYTELWNRRDYAGAERIVRAMADTGPPRRKPGALDGLTNLAALHGQLREAERRYAQANDAKVRVRGDTISPVDVAYFNSVLDGEMRETRRAGSPRSTRHSAKCRLGRCRWCAIAASGWPGDTPAWARVTRPGMSCAGTKPSSMTQAEPGTTSCWRDCAGR